MPGGPWEPGAPVEPGLPASPGDPFIPKHNENRYNMPINLTIRTKSAKIGHSIGSSTIVLKFYLGILFAREIRDDQMDPTRHIKKTESDGANAKEINRIYRKSLLAWATTRPN